LWSIWSNSLGKKLYEVIDVVWGRKREPIVKIAEMWLKKLEGAKSEELFEMAKEVKQIRTWTGNGWEVEAYELLLEDNGVTTITIDTNGGFEVVYKGNFLSIPLKEDRKHRRAYTNVRALEYILDEKLGGA